MRGTRIRSGPGIGAYSLSPVRDMDDIFRRRGAWRRRLVLFSYDSLTAPGARTRISHPAGQGGVHFSGQGSRFDDAMAPGSDAARRVLRRAIRARVFPAAVVDVGEQRRSALAGRVRHADVRRRRPAADLDTLFDLASLTKPLATATSRCSSWRRRVDLDEPVAVMLSPSGAARSRGRHDRDLLEHASGLPARLVDRAAARPPRIRARHLRDAARVRAAHAIDLQRPRIHPAGVSRWRIAAARRSASSSMPSSRDVGAPTRRHGVRRTNVRRAGGAHDDAPLRTSGEDGCSSGGPRQLRGGAWRCRRTRRAVWHGAAVGVFARACCARRGRRQPAPRRSPRSSSAR